MAILGFLVKIYTNWILSITFEPIDEIPCVTPFFHSKLNFPSFLFSTRVKIPKNGDFYFFSPKFQKKISNFGSGGHNFGRSILGQGLKESPGPNWQKIPLLLQNKICPRGVQRPLFEKPEIDRSPLVVKFWTTLISDKM